MKTIKSYKITKENYQYKSYMWDAELEALLSLFVKRLVKINPKLSFNKVSKEIIEKYIRKRPDSIVGATKIMREIYNKGGK